MVALSGTLTEEEKKKIPKILNMSKVQMVEESPDRPNIYLSKVKKSPSSEVLEEYENIIFPICDELYSLKGKFPVTLIFIPVYYMSEAIMYLQYKFGVRTIHDAPFSAICAGQDKYIIDYTVNELRKEDPHIRLVLTTSISGIGFDPRNVTRVIHACPPRNLSQYLQEIGRAGRQGQEASSLLYYSNRDIAKNLPGIQEDIIEFCSNTTECLRGLLLAKFGFQTDGKATGCKCCSICAIKCRCDKCTNV